MANPDSIVDEWFPVATLDAIDDGSCHPFGLLDERYLLVRGDDGSTLVTADTCPHRGAQLSLGSFDGRRVQCGYHGWEFDTDGRCVFQPAHPDRSPPAASGLKPVASCEEYGLLWVCVGENPREIPSFPDYRAYPGLSITLAPAVVESSGPRIVENFLDVAHFPFVHAGFLGEVPHTAVERYRVRVEAGVLVLSGVSVWQPRPGPRVVQGAPVAYDYTVSHPYAATLTKVPAAGDEVDGDDRDAFSILLVASPVTETSCRVFRVVTVRDPALDFEAQREFNHTIFLQDVATVESQRPARLPLDRSAEVHQPADAGSLAYRKWLSDRGTGYGTIPVATPDQRS